MKCLVSFLLVLAMVTSFSLTSFSKDLKIGYVDIFKVFNEYEKTKEYDANLEKKKEQAEKELDSKKEVITKLQSKISLLKEKDREKEQKKISEEVKSYRELEREAFTDIKKERDTRMKDIVEDINEVIKDYAKKNGFDLIINETSVLYGDKIMDVTSDILKISNKSYKKK